MFSVTLAFAVVFSAKRLNTFRTQEILFYFSEIKPYVPFFW